MPWDSEIRCTDASPAGWGSCSATLPIPEIVKIGEWEERWRYRRLPPSEWAPRRRALQQNVDFDVLTDPRTLGPEMHSTQFDEIMVPFGDDELFTVREGFPEVPISKSWNWEVDRFGMFKYDEHITMKEARTAVWDLEHSLRDPSKHGKHVLRLVDNFGVALALTKMRARSFGLLNLTRRIGALRLATAVVPHYRWVPSELNPSDEPSRRFDHCNLERAALYSSQILDGSKS